MTRYRFLDAMGDVVAEQDFGDHAQARAAATAGQWDEDGDGDGDGDRDVDVQRVEYLGPDGDWRWAGALSG
jgi:hypothetical protein